MANCEQELSKPNAEIIKEISHLFGETKPSAYNPNLLDDIYCAVSKQFSGQYLIGLEAVYLYGYISGQRAERAR